MASKTAPEVTAFIAQLPQERRRSVERVRDVIRKHLPAGYEEVVVKGMLVYQVPFKRYSDTYNGHPLWYAALASQKSYLSLHLMSVYADKSGAERLKEGFRAAGKKLDMGKACVRFKTADDLPLDLIGTVIAATPVDRWIAIAEAAWRPKRKA
jgi:uncharacterized protein YdhG (YjbR/CyaY superfamily)